MRFIIRIVHIVLLRISPLLREINYIKKIFLSTVGTGFYLFKPAVFFSGCAHLLFFVIVFTIGGCSSSVPTGSKLDNKKESVDNGNKYENDHEKQLFEIDKFTEQGDYENALLLAEKAFRENPDTPNIYGNLGSLYLLNNRLKDAEYHLLKAIEIDPTEWERTLLISSELFKSAKRKKLVSNPIWKMNERLIRSNK